MFNKFYRARDGWTRSAGSSQGARVGRGARSASANIETRKRNDDRRKLARGELDARILEHLMEPVGLSGALLNERLAVAREIPKLPDRCRQHEARPDEAVLEQLGHPHAVLHIGLPAGD